jgi:hypothetical protein
MAVSYFQDLFFIGFCTELASPSIAVSYCVDVMERELERTVNELLFYSFAPLFRMESGLHH